MLGKIKYQLKKKFGIEDGYLILIGMVSLFLLIGGFSFALFTTSTESRGSLNIVTANLYSLIESEDLDTNNSIIINSKEVKIITIQLKNINAVDAKFNLWYDPIEGVEAKYDNSRDVPPTKQGYVIKQNDVKTYTIRIENNTVASQKITFGSDVGIYNKSLSFDERKKVIERYSLPLYQKIFEESNSLGDKGAFDTSDEEQIFITGEDPKNYIWYSGKLWRAVSKDPANNSVKVITQWPVTSISYSEGEAKGDFRGSYVEEWLNDPTIDGFLGTLREPDKFIETKSMWNATPTEQADKPPKTVMLQNAVGLLNIYEFTMSHKNLSSSTKSYLNNGVEWNLITPNSTNSFFGYVSYEGNYNFSHPTTGYGIRPSINIKSSVEVVSGDGSKENPYRLKGDNDKNLENTLLNTRYSGEYVRFGTGENNLYQIVYIENGTAKLTSKEPLRENGQYKTMAFGTTNEYSKNSTLGSFLNNDFLNPANGYLTEEQVEMILPNSTWYLGTVGPEASYLLAKYQERQKINYAPQTTASIGLLRFGEPLATQQEEYYRGDFTNLNSNYWLITKFPYNGADAVRMVEQRALIHLPISPNYVETMGIKPAFYLKSDVKITGGNGTKENPFTIYR